MIISGQDLLNRRSKAGGRTFLSATDTQVRMGRTIDVLVMAIRESPAGINAPALIDFAKVFVDGREIKTDKTSMTLNISNLRRLVQLCGDDISVARGATLCFEVTEVNNPNYNEARAFDEIRNNPVTIGYSLVDWKSGDAAALPPAPAPAAANKPKGR